MNIDGTLLLSYGEGDTVMGSSPDGGTQFPVDLEDGKLIASPTGSDQIREVFLIAYGSDSISTAVVPLGGKLKGKSIVIPLSRLSPSEIRQAYDLKDTDVTSAGDTIVARLKNKWIVSDKWKASMFDPESAKVGKDGKFEMDSNTEPIFQMAEDYVAKAKEALPTVESIFSQTARLEGVSLDLGLWHDGTKMANPGIKSVASTADRLIRNVREGKGLNPSILKDHVRGTLIFSEGGISNLANVIRLLQGNGIAITKIDVKDNADGYKGVHLNAKTDNGLSLEIQLHTKESWELKKKSDLIYEKIRSLSYANISENLLLEQEEIKNELNQLLESSLSFKALRAFSSELYAKLSSFIGDTYQANVSDGASVHFPSAYSNNTEEPQRNSLLSGVRTNTVIDDFSKNILTNSNQKGHGYSKKVASNLESNAALVKDSADAKQDKVYKLSEARTAAKEMGKILSESNNGAKVSIPQALSRELFAALDLGTDGDKATAIASVTSEIVSLISGP